MYFRTTRKPGFSDGYEAQIDSTHRDQSLNYVDGQLALVSDNTLFGYTGPIMGRRYRFQVSPVTAPMYIANPFSGAHVSALFSTHPPVEERVRRLRAYDRRHARPATPRRATARLAS